MFGSPLIPHDRSSIASDVVSTARTLAVAGGELLVYRWTRMGWGRSASRIRRAYHELERLRRDMMGPAITLRTLSGSATPRPLSSRWRAASTSF